jgi:hypothetical protein
MTRGEPRVGSLQYEAPHRNAFDSSVIGHYPLNEQSSLIAGSAGGAWVMGQGPKPCFNMRCAMSSSLIAARSSRAVRYLVKVRGDLDELVWAHAIGAGDYSGHLRRQALNSR